MRSFAIAAVWVAGAVAPSFAIPAAAQTVYRCGNAYSHVPCAEGVAVNTDDARSAAQKAQSEQAQARDQRAAKAMEKGRLAEEKQAQASGRESVKVLEKIHAAPVVKTKPSVADEVRKGIATKKPKKTVTKKKTASAE